MLKAERLINFYEKEKSVLERLNNNEREELKAVIEFESDDFYSTLPKVNYKLVK
jgi:hypothetical protein